MKKIIDFFTGMTWDWPALVVAGAGIWLVLTLIVWHSEDSPFDLRHVIVEPRTERVSLHRLGQFVALAVSTMVLWYEMMHARLTEWLFMGYMAAWAGAALAKRWIDTKAKNREVEDQHD